MRRFNNVDDRDSSMHMHTHDFFVNLLFMRMRLPYFQNRKGLLAGCVLSRDSTVTSDEDIRGASENNTRGREDRIAFAESEGFIPTTKRPSYRQH